MMRWVVRVVRAGVVLAMGLAVLAGTWWVTRPGASDELFVLQEERLAEPALRSAADSAVVLLGGVLRDLSLPSLAVAVGVDGQLLWEGVFGLAHVGTRTPASLETTYRTASVSKSLTGMALLRLADQGVIDLDDEIGPLVPAYPAKRWPISFRHLVSHTGGVRHYVSFGERGFWRENLTQEHFDNVTEPLAMFSDSRLQYEPGTSFRYSTHGYTLLSAAMESAYGRPFAELMEAELFRPLGMGHTYPEDVTRPDDRQAGLYMLVGGRYLPAPGPDPSYKLGGGAFMSTASDLVRATGALLGDGFLSEEARTTAATEQLLADGSSNPQHYSTGWRVAREAESIGRADSTTVLHHGGAAPGASSFLLVVPESGISVAVLTNLSMRSRQAAPLRRMAYTLAGVFDATVASAAASEESATRHASAKEPRFDTMP